MAVLDKEALRAALLKHLHARVELTQRSHQEAVSAAEAQLEMRQDEGDAGATTSFLAAGQAARYRALKDEIHAIEVQTLPPYSAKMPIGLGALVDVENDDGEGRTLFVMKAGAGVELEVGDALVTVVTASSPLGKALMGRRVGDSFDINVKGDVISYDVVAVA